MCAASGWPAVQICQVSPYNRPLRAVGLNPSELDGAAIQISPSRRDLQIMRSTDKFRPLRVVGLSLAGPIGVGCYIAMFAFAA